MIHRSIGPSIQEPDPRVSPSENGACHAKRGKLREPGHSVFDGVDQPQGCGLARVSQEKCRREEIFTGQRPIPRGQSSEAAVPRWARTAARISS